MDYAYGHPSISDEIARATSEGRQVYGATYGAPQSQSARDRTALVANLIGELLDARGTMRLASFASGHARELETLGPKLHKFSSFQAIDGDRLSLDELLASYPELKVRPINKNVFRVRPGDLEKADFAYSMGLFDYLAEAPAKRVLKLMADTVLPGGLLLVGNLDRHAANLAYCEGVMDWWMVPRTADETFELGSELERFGWSIEVLRRGCFHYLLGKFDT